MNHNTAEALLDFIRAVDESLSAFERGRSGGSLNRASAVKMAAHNLSRNLIADETIIR